MGKSPHGATSILEDNDWGLLVLDPRRKVNEIEVALSCTSALPTNLSCEHES